MGDISCRFLTAQSKKVAKDVFIGEKNPEAVAWCVIPSFMKANNITTEEDINPIQLKAFWDKQVKDERKKLKSTIPSFKANINKVGYNGTIGASIVGDGIILNTIEEGDPVILDKYFAKHSDVANTPNVLRQIRTQSDMEHFELYRRKYDMVYGDSISDEEKIKLALDDMFELHSIEGYASLGYNTTNRLSNGDLAMSSSVNGAITIKESVTPEEFLDFITGKTEYTGKDPNKNIYALQKAVFEKMKSEFGITEENIKEIISNPYMARRFLYLREYNNTLHREDLVNFDKTNLLNPNNIDIVLRANMYAWNILTGKSEFVKAVVNQTKVAPVNQNLSRQDYQKARTIRSLSNKIIKRISPYFEGGGVAIGDVYHNIPEGLFSKIADNVMGSGQLTDADRLSIVQTFIKELDPRDLDELDRLNIVKKEKKAQPSTQSKQEVVPPPAPLDQQKLEEVKQDTQQAAPSSEQIPAPLDANMMSELDSIFSQEGYIEDGRQFLSQQQIDTSEMENAMAGVTPENQDFMTKYQADYNLPTPDMATPVTNYSLPKIGDNAVRPDVNSPLYRMSLQMDVTQINNRVLMLSHRITKGITSAINKRIAALRAKANNNEISDSELAELVQLSDEETGRQYGVPLVIDEVIKNLRNELQEAYDDMASAESDEDLIEEWGDNAVYMRDQYKILLENYDDIFDMACEDLENTENVRLYKTADKTSSDKSINDEIRREAELGDADDGSRATGNEGYSFSARMIDPHTSSRAVTRRILSGLHKVNYEGELEVDDLGEMVFVSEAVAYSSLINDLTKLVKHPTDFNIRHEDGTYSYPALEKLVPKYPWVKEILNKLHKNPDLGSALYTDLCKEFISYWTQYDTTDADGNIVRQSKRVNEPVARQSLMNDINNAYVGHEVLSGSMLWNREGSIGEDSVENLKALIDSTIKSISAGEDLFNSSESIAEVLNSIGVSITPATLRRLFNKNALAKEHAVKLLNSAHIVVNGALGISANTSLVNEFKGAYEDIADIIGVVSDLHNSITTHQGDADYSSYSTPNYIDYIKNGLKDKRSWEKFLMDEFGYDSFLYDQKTGKFRGYWLELFRTDKDVRDNFDIKSINIMDDTKYEDWTPESILRNFVFEFESVLHNNRVGATNYAYYAFPIFSDSTMANFIKMPKFIRNYKQEVTKRLVDLAKQELIRIKKVKERAAKGASQIQRFDSTGDKFLFMPELNEVVINGMGLVEYINSLDKDDIATVNRVLTEEITKFMERDATNFINNNLDTFSDRFEDKNPKVKEDKMEQTKTALSRFYWNNALAQSQIIQMMTTDLAYYKDYTDFQKRFKEVYASGARLNTQSKYGRPIERTIYLSDKIITSPTYNGIKTSLKNALDDGLISEDDYNTILDKFKNINAVDAQAYRTLSSYRAVMDMQGKWTTQMQESFDRFSQGTWNKSDFQTVWGTIKPFVFANLKVSDGLGGFQRVPHQNKNSEFLLLSFLQGAFIKNEMSKSPQLVGLNRAMEDFNIDVAQYQSAVKAGGQGIIDISYSRDKLARWNKNNNENKTWNEFKKYQDERLDSGEISQEEYNKIMENMLPSEQEVYDYIDEALHNQETANQTDLFDRESEQNDRLENKNVVHEISYEHYMIAQPTSNHLVDAESVFGSQFRNLITSDMPDDFEIVLGGRTYKAKNAEGQNEILDLYQRLITENLLEDWEKTAKLFGDIEILQKRLMQMVKGNPSYGPDILNALQIVEINGEKQFNIPTHNTTVANKVEQLIFSIFKNNITKQYIKGAACVLVSNYGFDNDLKVVRDSNGGITGFECLMPAHTKDLLEDYLVDIKDSDGNIIGQRIDETKVPKELLEGIGFRIPTEGKYSISNLIIKGFLPQQNGAAIMMPAELTQLAGSDFDKHQC